MRSTTTLVLLPGLDGSGELFWRLKGRIEPYAPVKVISYPPSATDTYDDHARRIAGEIGEAPCVVLGESFGGPIAIALAALHPGQVRGLILAATYAASPWPPVFLRAAAVLNPGRLPRFVVHFALFGTRHKDWELAAKLDQRLGTLPRRVIGRRLREVGDADMRQTLAQVRCPVLVLHGRRDWFVPVGPLQETLQGNARAVVKLYDGAHMLLQSCAVACADDIVQFLESLERP